MTQEEFNIYMESELSRLYNSDANIQKREKQQELYELHEKISNQEKIKKTAIENEDYDTAVEAEKTLLNLKIKAEMFEKVIKEKYSYNDYLESDLERLAQEIKKHANEMLEKHKKDYVEVLKNVLDLIKKIDEVEKQNTKWLAIIKEKATIGARHTNG